MSLPVIKQRLIRTALLAGIALCVGALIALAGILSGRSQQSSPAILNIAGIGGAYELQDQDGKPRTDRDFAGSYKLIYFGFASCPAICPTELQKMAEAYHELSDRMRASTRLIFITVDPERDTPKVLKNYVTLFDPAMTGLTGTTAQIENVKSQYKVYAAKVPDGDSYTVDHSSFIYFMGPDDKLIALFKPEQTPEQMGELIRTYIKSQSKR